LNLKKQRCCGKSSWNFKKQHCLRKYSIAFEKVTLLGQKQSWIRKTSTTAADAALHLKKQHCCRG